jgi:hypothetical protein
MLPHASGYVMERGNVVHGALGVPWGITLNYNNPATGEAFTFIAQPASAVSPWCATTSSTQPLNGRNVCLYTYTAGGNASFLASGVRYSVSPVFASPAATPAAAMLDARMLAVVATVR